MKSFKLTRRTRIPKDGGHVISSKNIIESGPYSYVDHVEISKRSDIYIDIENSEGIAKHVN
jgi:hypothetical protein